MTRFFLILMMILMYTPAKADRYCYNITPTHDYELVVDFETLPEGILVEKRPSYFNADEDLHALINTTSYPLFVTSSDNKLHYKQVGSQQFYKFSNTLDGEWKPNSVNGKDIPFLNVTTLLPDIPSLIAVENNAVMDAAIRKKFSFKAQFKDEEHLISGYIKYSQRNDFDMKKFLEKDNQYFSNSCGLIVHYDEFNKMNFEDY